MKKAGGTHVPTLFINTENYAEIALVENVIRQDLNPVEEAEALKRLMDDHGYKQEDLARIISKAPITVSETLSLNKLPKEIRDEYRQDHTVPKNVLVTIARSKQQRGMITQYRKFKEQRAKDAAKPSGTGSRRTPAEALANTLNTAQQKVAAVDLQSLTSADLTMVIEAMPSLKNTREETLSRLLKQCNK
jgi:ParB family chromosome partitioning protein